MKYFQLINSTTNSSACNVPMITIQGSDVNMALVIIISVIIGIAVGYLWAKRNQ